jgi:hypothetical protein
VAQRRVTPLVLALLEPLVQLALPVVVARVVHSPCLTLQPRLVVTVVLAVVVPVVRLVVLLVLPVELVVPLIL